LSCRRSVQAAAVVQGKHYEKKKTIIGIVARKSNCPVGQGRVERGSEGREEDA